LERGLEFYSIDEKNSQQNFPSRRKQFFLRVLEERERRVLEFNVFSLGFKKEGRGLF